jgi:hypothetical protein
MVAMFSYLAKLKKYPDFTIGKLEYNIEFCRSFEVPPAVVRYIQAISASWRNSQ